MQTHHPHSVPLFRLLASFVTPQEISAWKYAALRMRQAGYTLVPDHVAVDPSGARFPVFLSWTALCDLCKYRQQPCYVVDLVWTPGFEPTAATPGPCPCLPCISHAEHQEVTHPPPPSLPSPSPITHPLRDPSEAAEIQAVDPPVMSTDSFPHSNPVPYPPPQLHYDPHSRMNANPPASDDLPHVPAAATQPVGSTRAATSTLVKQAATPGQLADHGWTYEICDVHQRPCLTHPDFWSEEDDSDLSTNDVHGHARPFFQHPPDIYSAAGGHGWVLRACCTCAVKKDRCAHRGSVAKRLYPTGDGHYVFRKPLGTDFPKGKVPAKVQKQIIKMEMEENDGLPSLNQPIP